MRTLLLTLLIVLIKTLPAAGSSAAVKGVWDIHNAISHRFFKTIDTPGRVHLLACPTISGRNAEWAEWAGDHGQLFVLDKQTGELTGYNASNHLSDNEISDIAYNSAKGYLLIIYENRNIDILTDDNTVYPVAGLSQIVTGTDDGVYAVCFDAPNDKIYVATDFGYVVIDDEKHLICETQQLNKKVLSVACISDKLILSTDDGIYALSADRPDKFLDNGAKISDIPANYILPLEDNQFAFSASSGLYKATIDGNGGFSYSLFEFDGNKQDLPYYAENRDGYFLHRTEYAYQLTRSGSLTELPTVGSGIGSSVAGSWDFQNFYYSVASVGLRRVTYEDSWSDTAETFEPNAPRPYSAFGFAHSPTYGMFVSNNGYNRFLSYYWMQFRDQLSAFKGGKWTHYGSRDVGAPASQQITDSYNFVIDTDGRHGWVGSLRYGLSRINLEDKTRTVYGSKVLSGVNASSPSFDADGNLWCAVVSNTHQPLYCWPREAREADDVTGFKNVPLTDYTPGTTDFFHCLATKVRSGFVMFSAGYNYGAPINMLYTAGTPHYPLDDKFFSYSTFIDQNNVRIPIIYNDGFFEDPDTGNVWVFFDNTAFYFNPEEALAAGDTGGLLHVKRPVYNGRPLFDNIDVLCAAADGQGRLWFGTNGMGIYVVTPTRSNTDKAGVMEIESVYNINISNSLVASNVIYGMGFDPEANAMWTGTSDQVCTLYIDAEAPEGDDSGILAFPNPVRPDYQGDVTIQGLRGSVPTRILDSFGNEVRNLGICTSGTAVWDMTDTAGNPVPTGIYYIHNNISTPTAVTPRIHLIR